MSRRLRRNYGWMFLILLLAWLLKITSAKLQPDSGPAEFPLLPGEWLRNAAVGPLPGWLIVVAVVLFYGWLLYATLRSRQAQGELAHGDVHV